MFREWLILTEMTASQFLRRPENVGYARQVMASVLRFVSGYIHGNPNLISRYSNWFLKELIRQQIPATQVIPTLDNMWQNIGDYVVATQNNNQLQGKFNTLEYTYEHAVQDSDHWHMNMKSNDRKKGAPGRIVVNLDDLPGFQGWNWVALDRGGCGQEGEAMGHCGNAGGGSGQNLLSLRDPNDFPHLTFINHRGSLGEMKGKGNSKPSPRYHAAIVRLLLSNEVGTIHGGGYAAENNFAFADLPPELQQQVRARKPYIDKPEEFKRGKDRILRGLTHKARGQILSQTTPETVGDAVQRLVNRSYDTSRIYDTDTKDETPDHVYRNNIWKMYSELLNATYIRAKHSHPRDLFTWVDQMVQSFVAALVSQDRERWEDMESRTARADQQFFPHVSNIVKLDELIYRMSADQPEVMRRAPKRSRFASWEEYTLALRRFLDLQGYDLPPHRPDNHMISYEFNQKVAEEVASQGQEIARLVNRAYDMMDPRLRDIAMLRHQFNRDNPKDFFYGNEPGHNKPRRRNPEEW